MVFNPPTASMPNNNVATIYGAGDGQQQSNERKTTQGPTNGFSIWQTGMKICKSRKVEVGKWPKKELKTGIKKNNVEQKHGNKKQKNLTRLCKEIEKTEEIISEMIRELV